MRPFPHRHTLRCRADAFEAPVEEVCGVVQQAAADEQARLVGAAVALRREVGELLRDGMRVMTLSLSSTILEAVREAAGKPQAGLNRICWRRTIAGGGWRAIQHPSLLPTLLPLPQRIDSSDAEGGLKLGAIVCESRPLCEGVQLAAAWAEAGIECTLITDAQVCLPAAGRARLHGMHADNWRPITAAGTCACPGLRGEASVAAQSWGHQQLPVALCCSHALVRHSAPAAASISSAAVQAGLFVGEADLVLVGADAVTPEAVVNKAGTRLLALAARAAGVPMYVATDSGKLSPGPLFALAHPGGQKELPREEGGKEKGAEEVTAAWPGTGELPPG